MYGEMRECKGVGKDLLKRSTKHSWLRTRSSFTHTTYERKHESGAGGLDERVGIRRVASGAKSGEKREREEKGR